MEARIRAVLLCIAVGAAAPAEAKRCPVDSVPIGVACIDKYEASVWIIPATSPGGKSNASLVKKVQKGVVTLAQLTAGGATQAGPSYTPCGQTGSGCKDQLYAVSIAGVLPSLQANWFRALVSCANSLKRLPTNAEWQLAALGTPDPGTNNGTTDCNITPNGQFAAVPTGSRSNCVSEWGAWDMVGNAIEHVQEWVPQSEPCGQEAWSNPSLYNDDMMCLFGADTASGTRFPGVLIRGGRRDSGMGTREGVYAVTGDIPPSGTTAHLGFRCAR